MVDICKACGKNPINTERSKNYCTLCLEKAKARARKYMARLDKKVIQERSRKRYLKNRDKVIAKSKEYIALHPEVKKKATQNYLKSHAEQIKARNKKYKDEHRERYRFLGNKWAKEHPERRRLDAHTRRTKLNNADGKYSLKEWHDLCQQYDNKCLCCERTDVLLTVDHVIPISKGGSNFISNIQPLCRPCNSTKALKIIDFRSFGASILEWT